MPPTRKSRAATPRKSAEAADAQTIEDNADAADREVIVPPEQEGQVPDRIVEASKDAPAEQDPPPQVAAEIAEAQAAGTIPPPITAPDAAPPNASPVTVEPATDDPPGEGKWSLYNPTMGPILFDAEGRSVGGNERVLVDKLDDVAKRAVERGDLVKSKAAKDPHLR